MTGRDVERAGAEMVRVLAPHVEREWDVPAGDLDWSCWQTAAHIAHDLAAYAGQLAARADHAYMPYDLKIRPGTRPAEVLRVVEGLSGPEGRDWMTGQVRQIRPGAKPNTG